MRSVEGVFRELATQDRKGCFVSFTRDRNFSYGRLRRIERDANFISGILYFFIFYFAPLHIPVYILFFIVNLH